MDRNRTDRVRYIALAALAVQIAAVALNDLILKQGFDLLAASIVLVEAVLLFFVIYSYEKARRDRILDTSRVLGTQVKEAMIRGELGVIIYDDDYVATWVSELFDQRGIDLIGHRITRTIPGVERLLNGDGDTATLQIKDRIYEVTRSDEARVLYVKDVTEYDRLKTQYQDEKIVLGLIHLDNYDETVQYEDEAKIALINTNIRQSVVEWARQYGAMVRRLRSDRFLVVLDEAHFKTMVADNFSILDQVKKEALNLSVAITCSMAFVRGTEDFLELDTMMSDLLELVLSRGGDQAAVRSYGQEVKFYGTSSEASEKTSRVRVRVVVQTLKGIISDADQVFVVPHQNADYDAVGACLGVSRLVQAFGRDSFIVLENVAVEESAEAVLKEHLDQISAHHNLISEEEALLRATGKSLVICCDHHTMTLTAAPQLVKRAGSRVVIIDHHRRLTEDNIDAMMMYNEPASSSSVELVTELIEYQPARVELDDFEATFMYAGLVVDTNNLRSRCSPRTFECCAYLRKIGADITLANEWLKETYQQIETKTRLLSYAEILNGNILIAALPEKAGMVSRTMLSMTADAALDIKQIDASFVIARMDEETWAVSARSNGRINVQLICEALGGGGHFNAAGLQRKNTSVKILDDELKKAIQNYREGENSHESNPAD